jgi:hypothetical protein
VNAGEAGNGTGEAAGTPLFAGHETAPCPADANRGHSGRAGLDEFEQRLLGEISGG